MRRVWVWLLRRRLRQVLRAGAPKRSAARQQSYCIIFPEILVNLQYVPRLDQVSSLTCILRVPRSMTRLGLEVQYPTQTTSVGSADVVTRLFRLQ